MNLIDPNIRARLVYDGQYLNVPDEMKPKCADFRELMDRKKQLQGSNEEKLCELAGRICYDSLGGGRNSEAYWQHIREVGHLSVIEHARFTVAFDIRSLADALAFLNRKGVWVNIEENHLPAHANEPDTLRATVNLRTLLEWNKWTERIGGPYKSNGDRVGQALYSVVQPFVPLILPIDDPRVVPQGNSMRLPARLVAPKDNEERYVSLYLSGSRGFSHEQVRHRMSMSQRSTRYVDENESPYVEHPNTVQLLDRLNRNESRGQYEKIKGALDKAKDTAREAYVLLAAQLESALFDQMVVQKGVDRIEVEADRKLMVAMCKSTARKQARGAARGYLGNALLTEMIYTASVAEWRGIIALRLHEAADAEIRVLYAEVLRELKRSQYAREFNDMNMIPSPDGLGWVLGEPREQ